MAKRKQNVKVATNQRSRLERSWKERLQRLSTYLMTLHRKEQHSEPKQ